MLPLLRIALRNVSRNRRRSLISFTAVFLALTVMVSIRGLVNGMASSVQESAILGQHGSLQVHRRGFLKSVNGASLSLDMPADEIFLGRIEAIPGVTGAAARITFGAMANANDSTSAALVNAIDPVREYKVCPRRTEMVTVGRRFIPSESAAGILTPELANSLGIKPGERATLIANDLDGALNAADLDYVGTFGQPGLPLPDKKVGFVPLALAQELLRMPGRATEIVIAIKKPDDVDRQKASVQAVVGPDYEVSTWHEVAPWVDAAVATYHVMLNSLSGIFLFVALLGVVNTMLMSVLERTREIGTMMSVGVRRRQILGLFLIEAAFLGILGGLMGAAAGTGIVAAMAHNGIDLKLGGMAAPIHISPWIDQGYLGIVLLLAVVGMALAALWPAVRASNLRPVQALSSV